MDQGWAARRQSGIGSPNGLSLSVIPPTMIRSSSESVGDMRIKKLWRGLGWRGVVFLVAPPVLASFVASYIVYGNPFSRFGLPQTVLAPGPVIGVILAILFTWGRYEKSQRTKTTVEVLPDLLNSTEEFLLILRPFGSDGKVLLPARWFGSSTVEQVIARAARKTLGFKAYAIVDQDQRLAPPGPVYMRASNDEWKDAVSALIGRAHSVVLILPPGQGLRQSFVWEIDQLVRHELHTRTMIVLPPDRLYPVDYAIALQQACLLAATLEGQGRSVDEVFSLRVLDLEASLDGKRVHAIKFSRPHPWGKSEPEMYRVKKRKLGFMKMAWSVFYFGVISKELESVRNELSGVGFTSRYPWRRTAGF